MTSGMPRNDSEELGEVAAGIFGQDRVHVAPRLVDAIDVAAGLAETEGVYGSGGVLVTGSVITVGEARSLLKGRGQGDER
jgi:dihydrofolate synthase/folylpolyglutamate synthase